MANKAQQQAKKQRQALQDNTVETLKSTGTSTVKNTLSSLGRIGSGALDQLLGNYPSENEYDYDQDFFEQEQGVEQKPQKKEVKLFNYQEYREKAIVQKEIRELVEQIRKEIELIKKADSTLLDEIKDIHKITVEVLPDQPGIYHVRFLEVVLSILQTLRAKIGESKTWLEALMTKKKKRGSLFLSLSKKKGTQYSLSQEIQSARSVQ